MGMPSQASAETLTRAREMWEAGRSGPSIAEASGVSAWTVYHWRDTYGWMRRPRASLQDRREEAHRLRRRGQTVASIAARLWVSEETVHGWIEIGGWDDEPRVESAEGLDAVDREAGAKRLEILRLHREGRTIYEIASETSIPWPRVHSLVFDAKRAARGAS